MKKYHLIRQCLAIVIILVFVSVSVFPLGVSEQNPVSKAILRVDNEGDGDYSSIRDAVNNASQGDIIEVYSGKYIEDNITIRTKGIIIKGISSELENGNDSGIPLIIRRGWKILFFIFLTEGITITNLALEDKFNDHSGFPIILVQGSVDCIVSNNKIFNNGVGIESIHSNDIQIKNNTFDELWAAIKIKGGKNEVSGNVVSNANIGIIITITDSTTLTNNQITLCNNSIEISYSENNLIYNNHMENNKLAMYIKFSNNNTIKQNNFVNNEEDAYHINEKRIVFQRLSTVRNNWVENYWDKWSGIGPKIIAGILALPLPTWNMGYTYVPLQFIQFDWHPAKEPYNITI